MAKGNRKRANSGCFFQIRNKCSPKGKKSKYLPDTQSSCQLRCANKQSKGSNFTSNSESNLGYGLRRKASAEQNQTVSGNRIVDITKLVETINSLYTDHNSSKKKCKKIKFQINKEIKHGLAWKFQFKCSGCGFLSTLYSTFSPIPDSERSAAINTNLAMAIMDTSMGISRARLLFTALDIPPPSTSHMQKLTDKVSKAIIELNKEDMSDKLRIVEQHNAVAGQENPKHISVSMDGRYNARGFKSSYKPGQSSSQAYTVAMENVTKEKYIIGLAVENKLCWTGAWLQNRGFDVLCPGGHAGCTSTVPYLQPHSERRMAYDIAEDLSLENFWIRTVTTGGDTKLYLGLQDFYHKLSAAWSVSHQLDPHHLGSRQEKKARGAQFSPEFLPSHIRTKDDRQRAITALSKDIRARCSHIIEELTRLGSGDLQKMLPKLPHVRAATILCYSGNCSRCPSDSLVCTGISEGCWWVKSAFLPTHAITYLKMDDNDKNIMAVILEMRLSEAAVLSVSSNTSTQKIEAFNRAAVSTMNKETNYSRNFGGRLAAQVLKTNNSMANSVKRKLECVSGTKLSEKSSHHLEMISKTYNYHKTYKNTGSYRKKRIANRARLEFDYHLTRSKVTEDPDYIKGQAVDQWHSYTQPDLPGPSAKKKR